MFELKMKQVWHSP